MDYIQINIETTTEAVEAISNMLMDKGVGGVEIEDPKDILFQQKDPGTWDYIEEKLIKGDKDLVIIKAYFLDNVNIEELVPNIQTNLNEIKKFLDIGRGNISFKNIKQKDWADEWKKHFETFKLGENIVIKPIWKNYNKVNKDEIIIEIDPGMAFGTGSHETTSMCLELIEEHFQAGERLLDVGTGSGILAILAAKLGASRVLAVDLNDDVVKVARENAKANKCENLIQVEHGDLLDVVYGKFNIVVANIIADAIIPLSETVPDVLREDGVFISSGIIDNRIDDVVEALEKHFEIIEIRRQGEWAAIVSKLKR